MPDLALERSHQSAGRGPVAGIDEAGRGPWAGPVVAAAVILPADLPEMLVAGLDDSKKLRAAKRTALMAALRDCAGIGIGAASVAEISDLNILAASHLAMRRAVRALPRAPSFALIDGNLVPRDLPCPAEAVVGGDGRSLSIAAASIVAKVTRDRIMAALGARYPEFGWERNAGYGTRQHRDALSAQGVTRHHRPTFAPIDKILSPADSETPDIGEI